MPVTRTKGRTEMTTFDRITFNPAILGGKPVIRGTRISVAVILEWMGSGASRADIIAKHPHLAPEDIEQALAYAAESARNDVLVTAEVPS
jgi:uncharacterized protein (DUF433 family)